MYKHHQEAITKITNKLKESEDILSILVGGPVAHGYATEKSDVDILVVLSDDDFYKRIDSGDSHFFNNEICNYEGGYVDGKYTCIDFIKKVAEFGSEPARFAFEGAIVTYSKIEGIEELLRKTSRYPIEKKQEKINRFYAQLQAWKWYSDEALKNNNTYLLNHSVSNLILFGGRPILAYNEKLYPYHKWFLRVLEDLKYKPEELIENINNLLSLHNRENIQRFYDCIMEFTDWQVSGVNWLGLFVKDSELNWVDGKVPIADA